MIRPSTEAGNPKGRCAVEKRRLIGREITHRPGVQSVADEHHEKAGDDDMAPLDQAMRPGAAAPDPRDERQQSAGRYKANAGEQGRRQIADGDFGE
jgi:hypothetical protein